MLLTASNLASPGISHGFFTRQGGKSKGIYASLNCGLGSQDDKNTVIANRKIIAKALGCDADKLAILFQSHSNAVVTVDKVWRHAKMPKADAMVTNQAGIALGILTADCVPVLFSDATHKIIGAAHAGWKGAFSGVIGNTVNAMIALGATPATITCAIGPAIAQVSYEVDRAFQEKFLSQSQENAQYFIPGLKENHFMFNLKQYVHDRVLKTDITHINILENDTYLEEDNFFSYRRSTHKKESDYGRQISAILLK